MNTQPTVPTIPDPIAKNGENELPYSERTRAILAGIADINEQLKTLQDVTEAVRLIKLMSKERDAWRAVLYRLLKEAVTLLFPDRRKPRE